MTTAIIIALCALAVSQFIQWRAHSRRIDRISAQARATQVGIEKLTLLYQQKFGTPGMAERLIVDMERESMGLQGKEPH